MNTSAGWDSGGNLYFPITNVGPFCPGGKCLALLGDSNTAGWAEKSFSTQGYSNISIEWTTDSNVDALYPNHYYSIWCYPDRQSSSAYDRLSNSLSRIDATETYKSPTSKWDNKPNFSLRFQMYSLDSDYRVYIYHLQIYGIPMPVVMNTNDPTHDPTSTPSNYPTLNPSDTPTIYPTMVATVDPTHDPSSYPTRYPTTDPSADPTTDPSADPTTDPTVDPTIDPTMDPTADPTTDPTSYPTVDPTINPTTDPTVYPTIDPTTEPTTGPTVDPTIDPTVKHRSYPTIIPTSNPTQNGQEIDTTLTTQTTYNNVSKTDDSNSKLMVLVIVLMVSFIISIVCFIFIVLYRKKRKQSEMSVENVPDHSRNNTTNNMITKTGQIIMVEQGEANNDEDIINIANGENEMNGIEMGAMNEITDEQNLDESDSDSDLYTNNLHTTRYDVNEDITAGMTIGEV